MGEVDRHMRSVGKIEEYLSQTQYADAEQMINQQLNTYDDLQKVPNRIVLHGIALQVLS